MAMTDDRGVRNAMARQNENRLRSCGSEWAGPMNRSHEFGGDTPCTHRSIHEERFDRSCLGYGCSQDGCQMVAKISDVRTWQRYTRSHSVAAALQSEPRLDRRANRVSQVCAYNRSTRTCRGSIRSQSEGKSRAPEAFLQTGRNQPDHAGMPFCGRGHQHRTLRVEGKSVVHLRFRSGDRNCFDDLPLTIESVELYRDPPSLCRVGGGKQCCPKRRIPDPPPGIDTRTDEVAEVPSLRRLSQRRSIQQCGKADTAAGVHHLQTLYDQCAIQSDQWDNIRHGGECNEVEFLGEIREPIHELRFFTKAPVQGNEREEDDARSAEVSQAGEVIETVRVHQCMRCWQVLRCAMMV